MISEKYNTVIIQVRLAPTYDLHVIILSLRNNVIFLSETCCPLRPATISVVQNMLPVHATCALSPYGYLMPLALVQVRWQALAVASYTSVALLPAPWLRLCYLSR